MPKFITICGFRIILRSLNMSCILVFLSHQSDILGNAKHTDNIFYLKLSLLEISSKSKIRYIMNHVKVKLLGL